MRLNDLPSLFCLPVLVLLLSCGPAGSGNPATKSVSWWHFWAEPYQKSTIDSLITEFELANPGIKIKPTELTWSNGHEKITAAFAGDRAPDVLELGSDWIAEYAQRGVLADLTDSLGPLKEELFGLECGTMEGRQYAIPWLLGSRAFFVNTRLIPDPPFVTLEDMKSRICRVNDPKTNIFGFGSTKREPHHLYKKVLPFFWTMGGDVVSGSSVIISSPQNVRALTYYLELCDCGMLESQKNLDDAFVQGKIAVVFSGGWLIRKILEQNPSLPYRVQTIPSEKPNEPGVSFFGGEFLAVNRKSNHRAEALEWIRFLIRTENSLRISRLTKVVVPAARSGAGDPYFRLNEPERQLFQQLLSSRASPMHPKWNKIEHVVEEEIEQAIFKVKTPKQSLEDAQMRIAEILKR